MNLNQLPLCLLCAAVGAGLVKLGDRLVPDDTVTAKQFVVADAEGNALIRLDSDGVQVNASGSGNYTLIRTGDRPVIEVVQEGATSMTMGQSHRSTGVHLYRQGKATGFMASNDEGTAVVVYSPLSEPDTEITFADVLKRAEANAFMEARDDKSVSVGVRSGEITKRFSLPEQSLR